MSMLSEPIHSSKTISAFNTSDDTIRILIHTDPGNDIDDEIACGHLVRAILMKQYPTFNIHIVFSIKTNKIDRLLNYGLKPYTGIDFIPEYHYKNMVPLNCDYTLTIIFHDGTTFIPDFYSIDYILNIAPGLDNVIMPCNFVNLKGLSHQGLPRNWNGFNDKDSKETIQLIMDENFPYVITTPFEAYDTLFGIDTFEKYKVPLILHDRIAYEAFNIITKRMSPNNSPKILEFAESLVNIRYAETIGKPGTNCRLALAIRSKYTGPIMEISQDFDDWIRQACKVYVENISKSAFSQKTKIDPIKYYDETIDYLYQMIKALYEMNMPCFNDTFIRLAYSDDEPNESIPNAFETFKKIGIFTPAYDLVAAEKLINMLKYDNIL